MLRNKEKAVAIANIHGLKQESAGMKVLNLLDILIDELRKDNDTVDSVFLQRNQGEIRAYLQLKEYIERGTPEIQKRERDAQGPAPGTAY